MAATYIAAKKYTIPIGAIEKFYGQLAWLEGKPVYSNQEIANYQYAQLKSYMQNRFNNNGLITMINGDLSGDIVSYKNNFINEAITSIEEAFNKFATEINTIENLTHSEDGYEAKYGMWIIALENLERQIEQSYNLLLTDNFLSNQDIEQLNSIVSNLNTMVNELNAVLVNQSEVWKRTYINYWTKQKTIKTFTSGNGLISSVRSIINGVKGAEGELLGKNWINSLMKVGKIENSGNTIAVQMGDILGDVFTSGGKRLSQRQLTTDIGLFDLNLINDSVKITISLNGRIMKVPLIDFLNNVQQGLYNKQKVILMDDTYSKYMVGGVQSKMGQTQRIFNASARSKISLKELQFSSHSEAAAILSAIDDIFSHDRRRKKSFEYVKNHQDFNALFNYALSHQLPYLLGKDNSYILTRKGLQYIPDYIKENNYYFHITQPYKIGTSNTKYQVSYSKV